ncbi:MAG: hypothetical protein U0Y10_07750 [Spirosomataceae bacterium]
MRRQIKKEDSIILQSNWQYPTHGSQIREILLHEQRNLCAYTETYLAGRTDTKDIEHFDPTLKNTEDDNYQNWFLVKHQWNSEKASKWTRFQPILHPTADDFEERVVYKDGIYIHREHDKEAKNLIDLLQLNDKELVDERRGYIKARKKSITAKGQLAEVYFQNLLKDEPNRVYFIRAIEEEFGISLYVEA